MKPLNILKSVFPAMPAVAAVLFFLPGLLSSADNFSREKTSYPVFGILQVDPELDKDVKKPDSPEVFSVIPQYKLIYTADGPALRIVRDAKKKYGFNTPIIVYMGGFTSNHGGATLIEKKYRRAAAMIDVTTLDRDIDAKIQELQLKIPPDKEFPVKASTADISDPNNKSKYCFWIRIDDELMKVIKVDSSSGQIKVERGFDRSTAVPHKKGAMVFTPVYVGNRDKHSVRKSDSWPGASDYLRYVVDPSAKDAQQYKADMIIELMKTGYDGAWLDTFSPGMFNCCDPLGRAVKNSWDFRNNKRYDYETTISSLQEMLRNIRAIVKQSQGREPFLAANTGSASHAKPGMELLFSSPARPGLLDGYCFEDSYIHPDAMRSEKGKKLIAVFSPVSDAQWLRNLTLERDRAEKGLGALCMMGPAGYVAAYINPSLDNYDRLIRFSWCSFLLSVTKERSIIFGLPLLITRLENKKTGFLPLPDLFYYPVGDPVDNAGIEGLKIKDSKCYWRKFTNGLVIVRPAGGSKKKSGGKLENVKTETVAVPDGYIDPVTAKPVKQVTLEPGDGILLLKK